jgi:uncharacterized membrane protein
VSSAADPTPARTKASPSPVEERVEVSGWMAQRQSGPIPPPDVLKAYDEVKPGLAGAIVDAWLGEIAHRQKTEQITAMAQIHAGDQMRGIMKLGQMYAFGLGLAAVVASCLIVWLSPSTAGWSLAAMFGAAGVSGLVASALPRKRTPEQSK